MSQCELNEYRVIWQAKPYSFNPRKVIFVKAKDETDAMALACDWVERTAGLERSEFTLLNAFPTNSLPNGHVLGA